MIEKKKSKKTSTRLTAKYNKKLKLKRKKMKTKKICIRPV